MVPELQNESFGARIEVTNNVPIAVERSMYWNAEGRFWAGGSNALANIGAAWVGARDKRRRHRSGGFEHEE